jgi:SIR2-like domain
MNDTIERLIVAIQQRQLVIFCGAGISLSPPSTVPTAGGLTTMCIAEYNVRALPPLPATATATLEALTEHLFSKDLQSFFVRDLVPWRPFNRNSNSQHEAVADFLTSGAASFGLTTNFDVLIEAGAMELGADSFTPALDANQANVHQEHSPLLKLHGCASDPDHTLWCRLQLDGGPPVSEANQEIRRRLESLKTWLRANLREKTVLFVGFWTDWSYLASVLAESVDSVHIPLVVLVDPLTDAELAAKAPKPWAWAAASTRFVHLPAKGEVFLPRLREGFSKNLLARVLSESAEGFSTTKPGSTIPSTDFAALSIPDLYAVRRDIYGVPSTRIPRYSQPDGTMDAVGRAHLLLRHGGARLDGSRYVNTAGQRIRVVNGRTKLVNRVQNEFAEEVPSVTGTDDDFVICAGATDDGGTPGRISRGSAAPTVVRSGSTTEWITLESALATGLL